MGHDWVFDVLDDLKSYALANGLQRVAAKVEEALAEARDEVAVLNSAGALARSPNWQSGQ